MTNLFASQPNPYFPSTMEAHPIPHHFWGFYLNHCHGLGLAACICELISTVNLWAPAQYVCAGLGR